MGFQHEEEVSSPYPLNPSSNQQNCSRNREAAYVCSFKRQRSEEARPVVPSRKLQKANPSIARFLYYEQGRWIDFPVDLAQGLSSSLRAGKTSVDLLLETCLYFVSFLRMMLVNSQSAYGRSIAFIDEEGKRIGFGCPFEGPLPELLQNRTITIPLGHFKPFLAEGISKQEKGQSPDIKTSSGMQKSSVEDLSRSETSCSGENDPNGGDSSLAKDLPLPLPPCLGSTDSSSESGCGTPPHERISRGHCGDETGDFAPLFAPIRHKIQALNKDDVAYEAVKRRFLGGSGLPARATVQAVYQTLTSGACAELKRKAFEMQKRITYTARGNPNVRYAWLGAPKNILQNILLHGFSQPALTKRSSLGGVGVHFSGSDHPSLSMAYSTPDETGLQHMLLCQVILGNMEVVQSGSDQFQPSAEAFDSGVDDVDNPKSFCIWSTHMNTHIFPQYLISFKVSKPLQGLLTRCSRPGGQVLIDKKETCPDSPCSPLKGTASSDLTGGYPVMMSFPLLLSILKKHVPDEIVAAVKQLLTNFKTQKICRKEFMEAIKVIVGKKLLLACIGEMKSQVPSNIAIFCNVEPKHECGNLEAPQ